MKFSFIIPTRGRPQWLRECIESIYSTVSDVSRVEILLGMDTDDIDTVAFIRDTIITQKWDSVRIELFQRAGYHNLQVYVNRLAEIATGDYFIFFNDDARVLTPKWDLTVEEAVRDEKILHVYQFKNNHGNGSIFPILPRQWYTLLGHITLCAPYDSWIALLAQRLGVNQFLDIYAKHLRVAEDGIANQQYYKEVEATTLIVHKQMFSDPVQDLLDNDYFKLRNLLYSEDAEEPA
jgi:glycosyltransferase involved in cell wall biosynthesis